MPTVSQGSPVWAQAPPFQAHTPAPPGPAETSLALLSPANLTFPPLSKLISVPTMTHTPSCTLCAVTVGTEISWAFSLGPRSMVKVTTATAHVAIRDPDPRGLTPLSPLFSCSQPSSRRPSSTSCRAWDTVSLAFPGGRWARPGGSWECDARTGSDENSVTSWPAAALCTRAGRGGERCREGELGSLPGPTAAPSPPSRLEQSCLTPGGVFSFRGNLAF